MTAPRHQRHQQRQIEAGGLLRLDIKLNKQSMASTEPKPEPQPEPVPEPQPEPEPEPELIDKWGMSSSQKIDLDAVPALTSREISESEALEATRIAEQTALLWSLNDAEIIRAIFQKYSSSGSSLDMEEYGKFLKAIAYSKKWTDEQVSHPPYNRGASTHIGHLD